MELNEETNRRAGRPLSRSKRDMDANVLDAKADERVYAGVSWVSNYKH